MSAYVISVDRATPGTFAVSLNTGEASWTRSATVVELEAFGDAVAALGFERISLAPLRSARPANSALGALECFLQDVCDRSVRVPGAYALVHRFSRSPGAGLPSRSDGPAIAS